ncbi:MAG: Na+/H+ antiporter [Chthoniobacterales bacterium]
MHAAENICILLCVVAGLVIVARKFALPYPVVLVTAGLILGFTPGPPAAVRLVPEVFFFFVLPPLIYPAALVTSWRDFRRNLPIILLLATGLVVTTMFVVALVAHHFIPALPWGSALALGAIVSPTDTIAATTVIRRLAVPHRIEAILEGESLVNDATGLVALQFAVVAVMTGGFSLANATLQFVLVSLGGTAVGLVVGFGNRWLQRHLDDPPVQITVSLLTPFAAYLSAERLHVSGVLAAVAAGMFVGWHSPVTLSARTRLQASAFWEMIVFLLNGFIFIVIGLQLPEILGTLHGIAPSALAGYAAAVCGAVIGVRVGWALLGTSFARVIPVFSGFIPPGRHVFLIAWAGMRGVISLAAAFALPLALPDGRPFPGRNYILFLTFCVIFVTLVLQGLTLPLAIRALRIRDDGLLEEEERRARLEANTAALQYLDRAIADGASKSIAERLRAEYDDRLEELRACADRSGEDHGGGIAIGEFQHLQQEALRVERQTIVRLRNELVINDEALRRIQRDLDLAEARLAGE